MGHGAIVLCSEKQECDLALSDITHKHKDHDTMLERTVVKVIS